MGIAVGSGLGPSRSWAACPGSCGHSSILAGEGDWSRAVYGAGAIVERAFWGGSALRFFDLGRVESFFVGSLSDRTVVCPSVPEGPIA